MSRGCAQLADLGIEIQELPEAVECLPVHGVRLVPDLDEAGVVQQAAEVSSHASRRLVFDRTSNIGVDAVFVKGGPGGLIYVYDPPAESTGDTGLRRPVAEARPCSSWPASSCSSAEAHCSAAQSLGRVGLPDA